MKKVMLLTIFAALMMISSAAVAQTTASGTLAVTATVNGSIQLVFNTHTGGVALGSAGTNAATLDFGPVSAFGAIPATITRSTTANSFTVSTPVDVQVNKTNSASANYVLKVILAVADTTNTWSVGGSANINTQQTLTSTGAYGSNLNFPVAITIPFTTASGTLISNTINYAATAN
jgi:hypothetical protein